MCRSKAGAAARRGAVRACALLRRLTLSATLTAVFEDRSDAQRAEETHAEAVRRGSAALEPTVDDSRVDDAVALLERCDAIDVDERIERWREQGYGAAGTGALPRHGRVR